MLESQGQQYNQFANQMGGYGAEDRAFGNQSRNQIDQAYQDLYNQAGEGGGGGGGGPAYNPLQWANARENEALSGYRNLRDTGGWDPSQMADFRSRASSGQGGFFEGLKNQLSAQQAGGGGNVGYGSQMAKLSRDAGRGLAESQLGAETDLQGQIRAAKERGLGGVGTYDTEFMGNQQRVEGLRNQEIQNANAAASAASGRRGAAADDAFRNRMAILGERRGLRGESGSDLPYFDRQLAGMGGQLNTTNSRLAEQSFLDKLGQGAGMVGNLAGSAAGAMTGMRGAGRAVRSPVGGGKG